MSTKRTKKGNNQQHGEGVGTTGPRGGDTPEAGATAADAERLDDGADGGLNLPPVTDQQRDMAQQALVEFEKKSLPVAATILSKLLAQRNMDPKVLHNKAVVDFYQSGQRNLQELRDKLQTVCSMARITDVSDSIEDVDHAVVYYNQAVIFYYWQQYRAALGILEKLYHFIEPIEEVLARKILLLLTELYLCTHQPEKAIGIIIYTEKLLQTSGKSSVSQQDGANRNESATKGGDSGGRGDPNAGSREDPGDKLKPFVLQMKVHTLLMMKSMKSCKRELKTLTALGQTAPTIYLKSNFEYLRGNYKKASKILDSLPPGSSRNPMLAVFYNNNLGCLHFHQRKHHHGASYFRRAIEENTRLVKELKSSDKTEKGKPQSPPVPSRHYALLYNTGIQLLHCNKPSEAFDCLLEAVQVFQVNPLLWLRLAECCIMANKKNNEEDRQLSKRMEVVQESVGSGIHRKLILGIGLRPNAPSSDPLTFPSVKSLGFAALCLRNALLLLPEDPQTTSSAAESDSVDQSKSSENQFTPMIPANPMRPTEVENLRCSILTASAYVALSINDPLSALHHAESLLQQPRLSGAQRYLGHLYKAEALVVLDEVSGAIDHLKFDLASDISILPPEAKSDQEKFDRGDKGEQQEAPETTRGALHLWYPRDSKAALAILQYNLAAAHAIRGENEKALHHLTESSKFFGMPLPAQLFFLKLYLDLMDGRRSNAQIVLKDYYGHMTPNRALNPAMTIQ